MDGFEKNNLFERENALAEHELTPENRNENQIRLATEVYKHFNKDADTTSHGAHNDIMMFWVNEKYSKKYKELEESDEFKFHPRLNGDIFKITMEDMVQFNATGTLPE